MHQGIIVPLDILAAGCGLSREFRQNPLNFLLLLGLELNILIVGLNNTHGFHEHRGAGGGNVMDKARQFTLVLCLDRHDKSPVSLSNDGLLQDLPVSGRGDNLLQDLAALCLRRPHMTADIRQLRTGCIRNRILVHNTPSDLILQETISMQG